MRRLAGAILRAASWMVPRDHRAEWHAEWTSELCYLAARHCWQAPLFCLGAIPDALWLRRNLPSPARRTLVLRSPSHCLLGLALLTAASVLLAFRLPVVRDLFTPLPYRRPETLVLVAAAGHFRETPTISPAQYGQLLGAMRAAYYRTAAEQVTIGPASRRLSLAVASGNLFDVLGVPVSAHSPSLVLRRDACRQYFAGCEQSVGTTVEAGGRSVPLAAVISDQWWRLPGRVDGWLLEDDRALPATRTVGIVVGRLAEPPKHQQFGLTMLNVDGPGSIRFECVILNHREPPWTYGLMLAIALLLLPVATSFDLGHYVTSDSSWRRALFLAAKIALLLPLVFFGSQDLCSLVSVGLEPPCLMFGWLAALRWALLDQRRRCPICLHALGNPTRIGWASQVLLELYGTELICSQGHGLMQVPEIPSSHSGPRWLTFEQSWSSLFHASR